MSPTVCVCALLFAATAHVNAFDVKYYLFTRQNPDKYTEIDPYNAAKYVRNDAQIKIMIHGWSENGTTKWYESLKNALLGRDDYDVIEVTYVRVASLPYPNAVKGSVYVGQEIGDFIVSMTANGIPLQNIEIIGHSLGGQVAGYAGNYFFQKTSKKLPKITALDPAGPFFQGLFNLNGKSLSRNDAEVVYVIHTDRYLFGQTLPCGTVDVFPNGGAGIQPGCPEKDDDLFCSHHRSYWYYISAIENPKSLMAWNCDSYSNFRLEYCANSRVIDIGGEITPADKGLYYLRTSERKPYTLR